MLVHALAVLTVPFLFTARRVAVPDVRFDWLVDHWKPASVVPAYLHVVDIAGLVKGAHEGQVGVASGCGFPCVTSFLYLYTGTWECLPFQHQCMRCPLSRRP